MSRRQQSFRRGLQDPGITARRHAEVETTQLQEPDQTTDAIEHAQQERPASAQSDRHDPGSPLGSDSSDSVDGSSAQITANSPQPQESAQTPAEVWAAAAMIAAAHRSFLQAFLSTRASAGS
jgi:hypothetical protein